MEKQLLELLEFLHEVGISGERNISEYITSHFQKPTAKRSNSDDSGVRFLQDLGKRELIRYSLGSLEHINTWYKSSQPLEQELPLWFDSLEVFGSITFNGIEYLNQQRLNNSIIDSNRIISRNSSKQTWLLVITALITVCNVIVSIVNINSSDAKDKLTQQVLEQSKQIHALQILLSQKGTQSYPGAIAKKTLNPKK